MWREAFLLSGADRVAVALSTSYPGGHLTLFPPDLRTHPHQVARGAPRAPPLGILFISHTETLAMENTQTAAEALLRLEGPFASREVKWLVAATSQDGRKGRVTPYADPRAYSYISKVEMSRTVPTIATLYRMASVLEIEVHHLLCDAWLHRRALEAISRDPFLREVAQFVDKLNLQQRAVILRAVRAAGTRHNSAA